MKRAETVSMIPEERRRWILQAIGDRSTVRAADLAAELQVSVETIRRDLGVLNKSGQLKRVYGGAALRSVTPLIEAPFEDRQQSFLEAKRSMARAAVSLIQPDETVIFDVGTSVLEVARAIPTNLRCRVLTNSLYVAIELSTRRHVTVHVSGGELRAKDMVCAGPDTATFFANFHADRAFLGAGGIHPTVGLTDYYPDEVAVRQLILKHAKYQHVMADASKIGRITVRQVCSLDQLTSVITDKTADSGLIADLAEQIEVIVGS